MERDGKCVAAMAVAVVVVASLEVAVAVAAVAVAVVEADVAAKAAKAGWRMIKAGTALRRGNKPVPSALYRPVAAKVILNERYQPVLTSTSPFGALRSDARICDAAHHHLRCCKPYFVKIIVVRESVGYRCSAGFFGCQPLRSRFQARQVLCRSLDSGTRYRAFPGLQGYISQLSVRTKCALTHQM
jgi:hypothetical protein